MTLGPIGKFWAYAFLWLTVFAATGCDVSMPTPSSSSGGEVRTEKLKTNLTVEEARTIAQPASNTPGLSVDVQSAQAQGVGSENFDGTLQPSRGLNTARLFGTAVSSEDERFERLENAVQALRDDFDKVNPSINRLIAIEGEIQMLVDQLQLLVKDDPDTSLQNIPPVSSQDLETSNEFPVEQNPPPSSPPVPLAPALPPVEDAAPIPPPPAAPASAPIPAPVALPVPTPTPSPAPAPVQTSDAALINVRVADHDKTVRVVFETDKNISYTASVDPEKILLVTFAQGVSKANLSASLKSTLIKSADQTPQSSGGFIVAMPLSKMTKVIRQGVLQPDTTNRNYRIYIDLEK